MTRLSSSPRILAIPSEDGFGPSALLSYVVEELLARAPDCHVTVWNRSRIEYNRNLYARHVAAGRVELAPVWNLIQLDKPVDGRVSLPGTLRRIGDYRRESDRYPGEAPPTEFDLVVEFAVPAAARWAAGRGIPCVSLCDHSWSKTLAMIADDQRRAGAAIAPADHAAWDRLVDEVRRDEATVQRLFLFPPCITPDVFARHWTETLSAARVERLDGVLGGGPTWDRRQALDHLGLHAPGVTVMIQGGDTPVWDEALGRLATAFVAADRDGQLEQQRINAAIYLPDRLDGTPAALALESPGLTRVRRLRPVPGGTIQPLLAAVDLLVSRAGGGTVNDALACRVPLVCVHEPAHSQVEAILAACLEQGLTRPIDPAAFLRAPKEIIVSQCRQVEANRRLTAAMQHIPTHAERGLVARILR